MNKLKQTDKATYARFMQLEQLTNDYKQHLASNANNRLIDNNGTITIPVVVHVLHNGQPVGTGTNISDAQVFSQIATLNEDFNRLNADKANTPSVFQPIAGNLNFQFVLACTNPNGWTTNGINRVQSDKTTFPLIPIENVFPRIYNSPAKHTDQGGADAWPTDRYLNIWVCSMPVEGYGTFPALRVSYPNLDGVMVDYKAFGSIGSAQFPLNKGRTATHEVGHWLNIIHVWGDDADGSSSLICTGTDECDDTPNQAVETYGGANLVFGSPNQRSCGNNGDMYMNYMDYTDDAYMNLFTNDQKMRARAIFQPSGPRAGFIDNYFRLTKLYSDCSLGYYLVRTPFCAANSNITWSITGPATTSGYPSTFATVYPQSGINGTAILTASWNNMISDIEIPIGYGIESSYYNTNSPTSVNKPLTVGSYNLVGFNRWTTGQVSFTGATGPAKNWRISLNSSGAFADINGSGNSFGIYLSHPFQLVKVEAEIPTLCGDKTIGYYFTGGWANFDYNISPNPADNEITISASLPIDPNNRTSNSGTPAYEVQIFNAFNQLMKKTKVKKDDRNVTIDVSRFPSNQFYTIKLISDNDVQTKSFFKQ